MWPQKRLNCDHDPKRHSPSYGAPVTTRAMKPSFSLLITFQDPKFYTELNTKTKLDWGAEIICGIRA